MPRKTEKTYEVGKANYKRFFAAWIVGSPYIDIFSHPEGGMSKVLQFMQRGKTHPGPIHTLGTDGDLLVSGSPKGGKTPDEYVRERLIAWFDEDGETYMEELDAGHLR
ncbi:hypothetical protein [Streptomyces sp. 5-10]|uniref:hypothetical protein n=1 Tax=Streptomyces sp. 5-10 TaxID=878925 RepID=UPI00168B1968|nr:hypothetical protein [Streptomyces sp. 5-10]MBD3004589.1 hypothetical protein [Streptomyces sp. 5-10]